MGLFADEMVRVENLYRNWNYDMMYVLALSLRREQKMSSSDYECGHNSGKS